MPRKQQTYYNNSEASSRGLYKRRKKKWKSEEANWETLLHGVRLLSVHRAWQSLWMAFIWYSAMIHWFANIALILSHWCISIVTIIQKLLAYCRILFAIHYSNNRPANVGRPFSFSIYLNICTFIHTWTKTKICSLLFPWKIHLFFEFSDNLITNRQTLIRI